MKYPAIHKQYKSDSKFSNDNGELGSVEDYWKWAHSDLMDNAERGVLAEYIVATAVGGKGCGRENWAKYDVVSSEGITIEVKTSAYIQTWGQEKLSSIRFGIQETQAYDSETNSYESEKKRQADVYVFCIHCEKQQDNIDPLDLMQWEFYVLPSDVLNNDKNYQNAQSISLKPLLDLRAVKCSFQLLHETIIECMNQK